MFEPILTRGGVMGRSIQVEKGGYPQRLPKRAHLTVNPASERESTAEKTGLTAWNR